MKTDDHPMLTARFREALIFAAQLHANQVRKGLPVPYISHLLAVCGLVLEHGGDEDQAIAALLHDAVEDQGGPRARARIVELFGERVGGIVDGCTDADQLPKPPWRERKEAYLAHLRHSGDEVRLVSLADKVHNARTVLMDYRLVGEELWVRFQGGRTGTLWYYRALADIFNQTGPAPLAAELERVVSELERLTAGPSSNSDPIVAKTGI